MKQSRGKKRKEKKKQTEDIQDRKGGQLSVIEKEEIVKYPKGRAEMIDEEYNFLRNWT